MKGDDSKTTADSELDETISGKLQRLSRVLAGPSEDTETTAHNELSFAAEDLILYLNNRAYASVSFGAYPGLVHGGLNETSANEMIHQVKTEIRSVKGAVLNMYNPYPIHSCNYANFASRNFPAPALAGK